MQTAAALVGHSRCRYQGWARALGAWAARGRDMRVQQLWSAADSRSLTAFRAAVARDDLADSLLTVEGLTSARRRRCGGHLDKWAERVHLVRHGSGPGAQADALRQVLAREMGFTGEDDQQDRPCSVRMSRVMQRRRGTPVMLSAIWMEVGRRSGIQVDGLSIPGHFIARVGGLDGPLVDPASGVPGCSAMPCLSRSRAWPTAPISSARAAITMGRLRSSGRKAA